MEEKSKEIKMNPAQGQEKKKLSYDELKKLAQDVFEENRYLKNELYKANHTIGLFNRLDYLLRIVEVANGAKDWKFGSEFLQRCVDEIEIAMTCPAKEEGSEDPKSEEN